MSNKTLVEKLENLREAGQLDYQRNLDLYNDKLAGMSVFNLQIKYKDPKTGKPISATRVHQIFNKMKFYQENNIHINPAGKLSVGEITEGEPI